MEHIRRPIEIEAILSVGRNLASVGVNNWGLDRESALVALEKLSVMNVAMLGGDVYEVIDNIPELTYDNWYCDPNNGEAEDVYVQRSITKAMNYIANYQAKTGSVLFALVPNVVREVNQMDEIIMRWLKS